MLQLACLQAVPAAVATPTTPTTLTTRQAPLRGMPITGKALPMIGSSGHPVRGATFLERKAAKVPTMTSSYTLAP
ncbi:hypothetical protein OEZ86_001243 [Tetradesmus obliquus]|nr:hypothetical protein OEZ86_001243 [Tetradesmus obliquus]